jgi:hypothetical protein
MCGGNPHIFCQFCDEEKISVRNREVIRNANLQVKATLLHFMVQEMKRHWSPLSWQPFKQDPNEMLQELLGDYYSWGFRTGSAQREQR